MKTQDGSELIPKNLHRLVGIIAGNSTREAVEKNSFIVNEVPHEFQIANNEKLLASILESLLATVVNISAGSCIRVRAREYDDIMFLSVRDNSSLESYTATGKLEEVQVLARQINGSIRIDRIDNKFTTISVTFPNLPKAA